MSKHLFLVLMGLGLLSGCGASANKIQLKGSISDGKNIVQPLNEEDTLEVQLFFMDEEKNMKSAASVVDREGFFSAEVPAETDLRILVSYVKHDAKPDEVSSTWERFNTDDSPLKYRTTADSIQEIEIDLKSETVAKK